MAKIVDPDQLAITTEYDVTPADRTVTLNLAGNLNDTAPGKTSGVAGRALYSELKEEWQSNAALNNHRFPIVMIFEGSFQWANNWRPADDQTRDLIRDAGFSEVTGRENACIISPWRYGRSRYRSRLLPASRRIHRDDYRLR